MFSGKQKQAANISIELLVRFFPIGRDFRIPPKDKKAARINEKMIICSLFHGGLSSLSAFLVRPSVPWGGWRGVVNIGGTFVVVVVVDDDDDDDHDDDDDDDDNDGEDGICQTSHTGWHTTHSDLFLLHKAILWLKPPCAHKSKKPSFKCDNKTVDMLYNNFLWDFHFHKKNSTNKKSGKKPPKNAKRRRQIASLEKPSWLRQQNPYLRFA